VTRTLSPEQELEALVEGLDYVVRISSTCYTHVYVIYVPKFRKGGSADGTYTYVADSGEIAHKLFSGPPRWRWWRARRFVRRTIQGHRRLIHETGLLVR
jgi:hypothetical protein